ncbi:MAG: hypothetical protein GY930_17410 [bacterium]|nr:hypothetical protein [bacterium]
MPATIKLAREYGDNLGIILVESQGATQTAAEKFAWEHKWMGTGAMWTGERPFATGSRGLPNFALLSAEGKVLLMGNPNSMHGDIKDAIEAEIKKAQGAPDGSPKSLKKAYTNFAKGKYAKAVAEARKVAAKGGADSEDAEALAKEFVTRIEGKFDRVQFLMDQAYLVRAESMLKDLTKAAKELEEVAEKIATLEAAFAAEGMKDEMKAAKLFAKLEDKMKEEGMDEKILKKIAKFVEKNSSMKVAKRAKHLVSLGS